MCGVIVGLKIYDNIWPCIIPVCINIKHISAVNCVCIGCINTIIVYVMVINNEYITINIILILIILNDFNIICVIIRLSADRAHNINKYVLLEI